MAIKLAAFFFFVIAWGGVGLSSCTAQQSNMEPPRPESLQFGLELLRDQPEQRFTLVEYTKLPPAIRSQADNYLAFFLTPEAQPSKDPAFATRMFSTTDESEDDLVDYRWTFNGLSLRAVQSLNAVKLDIPLGAQSDVQKVKDLVDSVARLKGTDVDGKEYEVKLQWPNKLSDGVRFSSNPNSNIRSLLRWQDRLDAFVEKGRLSILIYKKIPQLAGYQDGSQWFEKYPVKQVLE
jgi:hypothetical protein